MGFKTSPLLQRTDAVLDVGGSAPPKTLRPGVAYHCASNSMYVFGGDFLASDQGEECQHNLLYRLSMANGDLVWSGPYASEPFCASEPNDTGVFNGPNGVVNRSAHVWLESAHPDFLLAQGGQSNDRQGVSFLDQGGLADLLAFDTRSQTWCELQSPIAHDWENSYDMPEESVHRLPVIHQHAAALDPITGKLFLFLAFPTEVEEPTADEGLPGYVFDTTGPPSTWDFQRLSTSGPAPSHRAAYTATIVGRRLIVFGGFLESYREQRWHTDYLHDVVSLDLDTMQWSGIELSGVFPSGRIEHGAIALDDDRLLILGGGRWEKRNFEQFSDAYILDFKDRTSAKLKQKVNVPMHSTWLGFGQTTSPRIFALGGDADSFGVSEVLLGSCSGKLRNDWS